MTDPLLSDARALAHRLGLIEPGPHGENVLKESAVRALQAFALRQRPAEPDPRDEAVKFLRGFAVNGLDMTARHEARAIVEKIDGARHD